MYRLLKERAAAESANDATAASALTPIAPQAEPPGTKKEGGPTSHKSQGKKKEETSPSDSPDKHKATPSKPSRSPLERKARLNSLDNPMLSFPDSLHVKGSVLVLGTPSSASMNEEKRQDPMDLTEPAQQGASLITPREKEEAPVEKAPAEKASVKKKVSIEKAFVKKEASVEKASVEKASVKKAVSTEKASVKKAVSIEKTFVKKEASVEKASVKKEASFEKASVSRTSVKESSVSVTGPTEMVRLFSETSASVASAKGKDGHPTEQAPGS